jgi:hypothetical protein
VSTLLCDRAVPLRGRWGGRGDCCLTAQVALSMVLVVGAGLFAGTLSRLHANLAPCGRSRLSIEPPNGATFMYFAPVERLLMKEW